MTGQWGKRIHRRFEDQEAKDPSHRHAKTAEAPPVHTPAVTSLLAKQRALGNKATVRTAVQTKLTVGPAGDRYEQEADRVAGDVMRNLQRQPMEEEEEEIQPSRIQRQEEEEEMQMKPLQRQEEEEMQMKPLQRQEEEEMQMKPLQRQEEEEMQMKPLQRQEEEEMQMKPLQRQEEEEMQMKPLQRQEEEEMQMKPLQRQEEEELQMKPLQRQEEEEMQMKPLQRQEEEELQMKPLQRQEEEELQMKPLQRQEEEELQMKQAKPLVGMEGGPLDSDTDDAVQGAKGGGKPLEGGLRRSMEGSFGADFSGVKVHDGPTSHEVNEKLQSKAFTTGSDIFFRQGDYNPATKSGQELVAHELTHVVQQGAARRKEKDE